MSAAVGSGLADAVLAARLCVQDPRLGGLLLSSGDTDMREAVLAAFADAMPERAPVRRLPSDVDEEALLGGVDLGAALAGHGLRRSAGLLAAACGGLVVVPAVERLTPANAAILSSALDRASDRDAGEPERFVVAAFDGSEGADAPPALRERLAFQFAGDRQDPDEAEVSAVPLAEDEVLELLAGTAAALGIGSARAPLLALWAAFASAKLAGRVRVGEVDLVRAIRLVLAPRATRLPAPPEAAEPEGAKDRSSANDDQDGSSEPDTLADRVIEAARAAIDADLIAQLQAGRGRRGQASRARGAGEKRRSPTRGRPIGTRPGMPRGGARLALIDTLRAAAPWQRLRGRSDRVLVRRADLRIRRHEARAAMVTIFAVDASGSAALARLAEAKGAVELLLGQAYVQRAEVALVAFRGTGAELLLPPTRSLARARRALAELPGGGGTPLSRGIEAVHGLALATRAKGRTPFIVVLSDGRANIAADGTANRAVAQRDALAAARSLASDAVPSVFVDTSPRPRPEGQGVAEAMGARYLPLPYAGAEAVGAAIRALAPS